MITIALAALATGCGGEAPEDRNLLLNPVQQGHPYPQPRVGMQHPSFDSEKEVVDGGKTTLFKTKKTHFPKSEPFKDKTPGNLLPTVYEPVRDSGGDVVPNTLPSTAEDPYNLHPDPEVEEIDMRSPAWDLAVVIRGLKAAVDSQYRGKVNRQFFRGGKGVPADPLRGRVERTENQGAGTVQSGSSSIDFGDVQFALNIIEGEPVNRAYSGMSLLKYDGACKVKKVDAETNTVTVRQAWTRGRIKSDTMFIDPSTIPADEEWTIRYKINVLHWGHEDFAPTVVTFDDPKDVGRPNVMNVAFDQTFFPMQTGKRYTFEIAMPPHRYWNLTYHWGWRVHPPRVQAIEKALKAPMGKNIVQWEKDVFGDNPCADEQAKREAIAMIGDLAPAKRMWKALKGLQATQGGGTYNGLSQAELVAELEAAFRDWRRRDQLPRGVQRADGYDQTLVYLNNSLYGGMHEKEEEEAEEDWPEWQTRGATLETKIYNGDYYPHAYMNVDFGGRRGWANTFQHTIPLGGQGPWFTFGRFHISRNLSKGTGDNPGPRPILVPAAQRPSSTNLTQTGGGGQVTATSRTLQALSEVARPQQIRTVQALPEATPEALNSVYMPHPGEKVAAARTASGLGVHNLELTFRFEPSTRLRFYQFDPLHHTENVFSVH